MLKIVFSSVVLSSQSRRTNEPGMASSVAVSKTLTCEEIMVLRVVSIGGGREQRAFSMAVMIVKLVEASEDEFLPMQVVFGWKTPFWQVNRKG